jgi:aminoglycoside phosphotransferase (APT) family kinase protein
VELKIDISMATSFLVAHYGGAALDVILLGEGAWSRAFGFRANGHDLVARFGAYREDFEKDQYAFKFAGPDLPVPMVIEVGQAFDGAFAISERCFGSFLELLDFEPLCRLLPSLLRLFDAMREFPVDQAVSVRWPPNPRQHLTWHEWLASSVVDEGNPRVGGWRGDLAKIVELDELFDRGVDVLHSLVEYCPSELHLIHGDLLNRNVLVNDDALRLEAVFDWGCSMYGDFLYDIAWFTFWAPWYPGVAALDVRTLVQTHFREIELDVPNFTKRLACYELQIGLTHLAYNTLIKSPDARLEVAQRTEQVLSGIH